MAGGIDFGSRCILHWDMYCTYSMFAPTYIHAYVCTPVHTVGDMDLEVPQKGLCSGPLVVIGLPWQAY